ncbi:MAG: hypothetical protein KKD73_07420 [Proteobacteria bacterium]|nr:hypothetical protein [Pseudomonadota bacterium]
MTKIIKSVRYSVCLLLTLFVVHFGFAPAYGSDAPHKTKVDPRDIYLDLEGLCGCEGLPYAYTTPPEKHVKTKVDSRDIYLDMEAMCGCEGLPYKYLIIPSKYVKIKHDPEDLKFDLEKMTTEDPSVVPDQKKY